MFFPELRTYVQSGIYDKFVEKAREKALKRTMGDGYNPATQLGKNQNFILFIILNIILFKDL